MKRIIFSSHALQKMKERTTNEVEVIKTIHEAKWQSVKRGRFRCSKWFTFQQERYGIIYKGKDVQPIFVEEAEDIIVITVYVYFNQREGEI